MELFEREPQMRQLEEHLRQAVAGRGRMVLIGGEAGVGKSALMEEFCRRADEASVIRMSCDALSTPSPVGPAGALAPALGIPIDHLPTGSDDRDRVFRAVLEAFAARSGPTVAVGENADWADGVSFEFLRFLARRIGELRVLFVVTYRDDEVGTTHQLRLLLGDLATTSTVGHVRVSPLSE